MNTHPLFEYSSLLTNAIRSKLKISHVGIHAVIKGADLCAWLNDNGFPTLTHRQMRHAIREMRRQSVPICSAGGRGYFWPASLDDVLQCRQTEFQAKAKDMLYTGRKMYEGAISMFGNQRSLL